MRREKVTISEGTFQRTLTWRGVTISICDTHLFYELGEYEFSFPQKENEAEVYFILSTQGEDEGDKRFRWNEEKELYRNSSYYLYSKNLDRYPLEFYKLLEKKFKLDKWYPVRITYLGRTQYDPSI